MATLHLLMGLPGAGKTTLAKLLEEITSAKRLSSDELRLQLYSEPNFSQQEHDELYSRLNNDTEWLLASGNDVIYDANLNRHMHREEKYRLAKKYNANVILWWVQTPKHLARSRRVEEQDTLLLPSGEDSERMFERIALILEEPHKNETFIAIDGTHMTKDIVQNKLATKNR